MEKKFSFEDLIKQFGGTAAPTPAAPKGKGPKIITIDSKEKLNALAKALGMNEEDIKALQDTVLMETTPEMEEDIKKAIEKSPMDYHDKIAYRTKQIEKDAEICDEDLEHLFPYNMFSAPDELVKYMIFERYCKTFNEDAYEVAKVIVREGLVGIYKGLMSPEGGDIRASELTLMPTDDHTFDKVLANMIIGMFQSRGFKVEVSQNMLDDSYKIMVCFVQKPLDIDPLCWATDTWPAEK